MPKTPHSSLNLSVISYFVAGPDLSMTCAFASLVCARGAPPPLALARAFALALAAGACRSALVAATSASAKLRDTSHEMLFDRTRPDALGLVDRHVDRRLSRDGDSQGTAADPADYRRGNSC